MYKKIIHFKDKKHFGSQIVIYKSEINYLIIMKDRDGQSYYFLDNKLEFFYPMNTYMKNTNFNFDFDNVKEEINQNFELDLLQYGHSTCPEFIKKLIRGNR